MSSTRFSLLLVLLAILLFCACGNDDDDCVEYRQEHTFSLNKSIAIDSESDSYMDGDTVVNISRHFVIDGQDMLFDFTQVFSLCDDDIADGVAVSHFYVVVPTDSSTTFTYTDMEILQTSAFVEVGPLSDINQGIEEGEIVGTKIDENSWQVSIDIVTKLQPHEELYGETQMINVDAVFSLE